jgi:hypothetical protein
MRAMTSETKMDPFANFANLLRLLVRSDDTTLPEEEQKAQEKRVAQLQTESKALARLQTCMSTTPGTITLLTKQMNDGVKALGKDFDTNPFKNNIAKGEKLMEVLPGEIKKREMNVAKLSSEIEQFKRGESGWRREQTEALGKLYTEIRDLSPLSSLKMPPSAFNVYTLLKLELSTTYAAMREAAPDKLPIL